MLGFNFVFSFSVPRLSERVSKKKDVSKDPRKLVDAPPSSTSALEGASIVDLTEEVSELPITGASSGLLVSGSSDAAPIITEGEQTIEDVLVLIRPKRKAEDLSLGTPSGSKRQSILVEPQHGDHDIEAKMVSYEFSHLGLGPVEVSGYSVKHPALQVCFVCIAWSFAFHGY